MNAYAMNYARVRDPTSLWTDIEAETKEDAVAEFHRRFPVHRLYTVILQRPRKVSAESGRGEPPSTYRP